MKKISDLNRQDLINISTKKFRGRKNDAFGEYIQRSNYAIELNDLVASNTNKINKELIYMSRANCIVNLMTYMERFFKASIVEFENKWRSIGFNDLLNQKITINDAFDLYKEVEINKVQLLAHVNSFQSLERINLVFSQLTGTKFIDFIGKYEYLEGWCMDKDSRNWKSKLVKYFDIRHRIIHENDIRGIKPDDPDKFDKIILELLLSSTFYFLDLPNLD